MNETEILLRLAAARAVDQAAARLCPDCRVQEDGSLTFCLRHAGVRGPTGVQGPRGVALG